MAETKSPNRRVPSFLIYRKIKIERASAFNWNPGSKFAINFFIQTHFKFCETLTDIAKRISQSFSLEDSCLFLGVAFESRLPRFEAAHQILEIWKLEASRARVLYKFWLKKNHTNSCYKGLYAFKYMWFWKKGYVQSQNNLSADFYRGTAFDVV